MTKDRTKEYCEAEFENIDATVAELVLITEPGKAAYSTADLAAMATFIHNIYNGIENILKRVLTLKKKQTKEGAAWHKDLLKTSVKADIISPDLCSILAKYLSFRHFFIHGYGFTLKWEALQPLVANIDKTLRDFKTAVYRHLV
ncbi:hypothetical protein A3H38_00525 [candidate division WOR-1 bacterium RIFCSPLOWO2_02_FULL_46_20]|uniref:HepT-like domain-containing protein n=2 Tax=Saganbacteria TaxID=1703751 RepID=A0A1F4RF78_UNCSA|nr:MAG: hypothetical protein A3J44_02185 [candidate division WOR-1 bacterium RIFCSPHIGHO2_02_FULL_45_12]OGC06776.1 MAG: hypothetical protein A3H38_00525 [candidate division WOR-1 bacterium RIFCSPLOWO2_02_FULL_46_20]OGC07910.1 MAG: hypothetical protein A3F86_03205 [candidate division WOR-1 bacterium RIFCSPLOWO2_12_FULL_45_9]